MEVRIQVALPESDHVVSDLPRSHEEFGDATVRVSDTVQARGIHFDRVIDIPAGRVAPGESYAAWQQFVRRVGDVMSREVLVAP
jgi:hypothetical protein